MDRDLKTHHGLDYTKDKSAKYIEVINTSCFNLGQEVHSTTVPGCATGSITCNTLSEQTLTGFHRCPAKEVTYKKVGQYLLGRRIAEGSYCEVRLAVHLPTGIKAAVKVVSKRDLVQCSDAQRHFRREVFLLQNVQHPNIARFYGTMETSSSYYLVLELVTGGHLLARVLDSGNLTEADSRHYLRHIVSAVDHLHTSDIVHRNLTLENMLVDAHNNIKLVGFGFSAVCQGHDFRLSTQCVSPLYAAPEIFAGKSYGKPVDVWSIGVCLFAILLGRLPFLPGNEGSLFELHQLILKGCHVPGHLSSACASFLTRAMELDDNQRITTADMMSHPWLTTADGQHVKRVPAIQKNLQRQMVNRDLVSCLTSSSKFSYSGVIGLEAHRKQSILSASNSTVKSVIEATKEPTLLDILGSESTVKPSIPSEKLPTLNHCDRAGLDFSGLDKLRKTSFSQNSGSGDSTVICQTLPTDKSQTSYKSQILRLKNFRQHLQQDSVCQDFHYSSDSSKLNKLHKVLHASEDVTPQMTNVSSVPKPTYVEITAERHLVSDVSVNNAPSKDQQWKDLGVKGMPFIKQYQNKSDDYHSRRTDKLLQDSRESRSQTVLNVFLPREYPQVPHENSTLHSRPSDYINRYGSLSLSHDFLQKSADKSKTTLVSKASHASIAYSKNPRSVKSLPRSVFSLLRDPFNKDTWDNTTYDKQTRKSKHQSTTIEEKRQSSVIKHKPSYGSTSWVENGENQDEIRVNCFGQSSLKLSPAEKLHCCCNLCDVCTSKTTDTMTSAWHTAEVDPPGRHQADLEDFLLPVTRVVITTTERP